jgi:general secretion pathway protein H
VGMKPPGGSISVISAANLLSARGRGQKNVHPRKDYGFTLLELMVVLALLTLLIGLVMPGLLKSYQREQERSKTRRFLTLLRSARSEAITRHQPVRLAIDLNTGLYNLEGFAEKGTLNGLHLEDPHLVWDDLDRRRGHITFYPDGSSSGGRLVIIHPGGNQYLVEVDTITGKVAFKVAGR